jgi:hypothetical protein
LYFVVCDVCGLFSKRDLRRWILLYFPMDGKRIKIYYKGIQKLLSKVKTVKEQLFQNNQSCCLEEGALQLTSFYVMFTFDLYFTKNCHIFIHLQCDIINCNAHYRCNHVHGTIKIVYF